MSKTLALAHQELLGQREVGKPTNQYGKFRNGSVRGEGCAGDEVMYRKKKNMLAVEVNDSHADL